MNIIFAGYSKKMLAPKGDKIKVLISTIIMDVITKSYHTMVGTYKATLHQHLSEVTTFKINKRHSFSINSVTIFIHQAYNNKDLLATTVMMIKTLAPFFSKTSTILFSE